MSDEYDASPINNNNDDDDKKRMNPKGINHNRKSKIEGSVKSI